MRQYRHVLLVVLALACTVYTSKAQSTAFTYQGRLEDDGRRANGPYDFRFVLYDAASGGSQVGSMLTNNAVAVSNGLFTEAKPVVHGWIRCR